MKTNVTINMTTNMTTNVTTNVTTKRDNKHDSSFCSRDLISVDDDYVAEHEAKILKEADLQEKILEAVEKLRQQIRQLKNEEEGDHLPVS